jgi:peptidoglycan/LPS O-acetylase OafA/YrhL
MGLLLLFCLVYVGFFQPEEKNFSFTQIFISAAYVSNMYVIFGGGLGMLTQTWSLSVEEQFYTFWPILLLFLLKKYDSDKIYQLIIWMVILSWAIRCLLYWQGGMQDSTAMRISANFLILSRTDGLMLGALAAIYVTKHSVSKALNLKKLKLVGTFSALVLLAALLFAPSTGPSVYYFSYTIASLLTAALIASFMLTPPNIIKSVLSFKPLTFIGKISYGLYLFHVPVYALMPREVAVDYPIFSFFGGLIVSFFVATASYYLVEVRFLRIKNKLHISKNKVN